MQQQRRQTAALLLLLLPPGARVHGGRARWQQDRFAIGGGWFVPPSDAHYSELAAANFTVLVGWQASNVTGVRAQLALCERHGLNAIVSTCGGHAARAGRAGRAVGAAGAMVAGECVGAPGVASSPAFWGYEMQDEPSAAAFAALANFSRAVGRASPGSLRFFNLLPNYASNAATGAANYGAYVAEFVRAVAPDVLCADHYPYFEPNVHAAAGNMTQDGYHSNLRVLRAAGLASGTPFWNFFNAIP